MNPYDLELTDEAFQHLQQILERDSVTSKIVASDELNASIAKWINAEVRPYSTDWDAAMEAVSKITKSTGCGFILRSLAISKNQWRAEFFDGDPVISNGVGNVSNFQEWLADAPTGPLAICRAISLLPQNQKP